MGDDRFGEWTTTDERLQELQNRLVAWWFASFIEGTELREVWVDAYRRYCEKLAAILDGLEEDHEDEIMDAPKELIFEAFEEALADHDAILRAFPHEMPEGWEEWLPNPPKD